MIQSHHQTESTCEGVRPEQQAEEGHEEVCLGDHAENCCGKSHEVQAKDERVITELILTNQDHEFSLDDLKQIIHKNKSVNILLPDERCKSLKIVKLRNDNSSEIYEISTVK